MGGVEVAFDLLYTDDPARATELAARLEAINRERREIESTMAEEALAKVDASYDGSRVIVVGGEGWHEGVKGIACITAKDDTSLLDAVNATIARLQSSGEMDTLMDTWNILK